MRLAAAAITMAITACGGIGGDDGPRDPHEVVSCDSSWEPGPEFTCEAACESRPTIAGGSCRIMYPGFDGPEERVCGGHFTFDGVDGCCELIVAGLDMFRYAFFECL